MFKIIIKVLIVLLIILSASVIKGEKCTQLSDLKWLLGHWQATNESTIVREVWKQVSNKTFEGIGESLDKKSGELKFSESMRIVAMSNKIYYIAKVQENTYPTPFELTQCSSKTALFENPDHDFPKKLSFYMTNDLLMVDVLGKDDKGFTIEYSAIFPSQ